MVLAAPLTANHSNVALAPHPRGGGGGTGRHRRRGSPFAALSDAYKPPRAWLAPAKGRGGGEIVTLRSATFTWPTPLERVAADPRHLQNDRSPPLARSPPPTLARMADHDADHERQMDPASGGASEGNPSDAENASPAAAAAAATATAVTQNAPSLKSPGGPTKRRAHQKRVTWAGSVETIEVTRQSSCNVFSPDLHSLEIAKRLAVVAEEPELTRAVDAITLVRRNAAGVVRSLTARHGWSGSLDGVEEACRVWTWSEGAYLSEMDDLVRCVVSLGGGGAARGDDGLVWRLKANYRAARRRMDDAESD